MTENHHTAFGLDGERLPLSPDEVQATAHEILRQGKLVLVISVVNDSIAVNVMGKPGRETLNMLETAVDAYRKIIEEHGL